jgi:pimeloyl-ACP methyl ester carboxylesterase
MEAMVHSVSFTGTDGQRVSAHHLGGRGRPLLIAHAAGFCGGAYQPLADELASEFEVWALDLRGHGDSPAPADGDFSWDGMARDVLTAVDGLGLAPMAFFGHSLGGASGMRAEALRPGTFSAIYLYEPALLPARIDGVAETTAVMVGHTRARRAVFASHEEAVTRLGARPPYNSMRPEALLAYVTHGTRNGSGDGFRLKCEPEHEARVYEAENKITFADVSEVRVPVLIGMGEREAGLPAAAAPLLAEAMVVARIERFPGLGHMGPFEDPALVAEHAARHLRSADGAAAGRPADSVHG